MNKTKDISEQKEDKPLFHKLTPLDDVEISVYSDALDFVFENADVRNVAVSGAYGAGKSSVLESYKKQRPGKKFLHISLANFKPDTPHLNHSSSTIDDSEAEETKTHEKKGLTPKPLQNKKTSAKSTEFVLEGKILNQLLHQISTGLIPQTGFRIKREMKRWRVAVDTLALVAFVGFTLYQIFFEKWKMLVSTLNLRWGIAVSFFKWTASGNARLLFLLVGAVLFVWGVGYAVRKQRTTGLIKKVCLQGNELEIGRENDESLFDKYLNEVLYLFEHADADVIVFEDLDRHESTEIFTRLREINTLVNQRRPKKVLRFFYLLRDDIFATKDRAKFFDFILPIVPVVDGFNAYDKFLESFKKVSFPVDFTPHFLQELSLYIDEMRILKNIINEFNVYYRKLSETGLNCDRMLALIAYKNIFPKDFAELQLNRGFVYTLFQSKPALVEASKTAKTKEIEELVKKQQMAGNAFLTDTDIDSILEILRGYHATSALRKKLENTKSFYEMKVQSEKDAFSPRIAMLKEILSRVELARLCEVLTRDNIEDVFSKTQHVDGNGTSTKFEEVKGSAYFPFLKFLLRNGHVDESYPDYLTYFYPESLSRNDKLFLRSVTDRVDKGWRYTLKEPKKVIDLLSRYDFEQIETLNFNLLSALLLSSVNEHSQHVQKVVAQLERASNTAFVNEYLQVAGDTTSEFIRRVNDSWPGFFAAALADSVFLPEHRILWARTMLCVSSDETIKAVNQDNCLGLFIADTPEFLDDQPIDGEKLISGMQLIGVEMKTIRCETAKPDLLKSVYECDMYVLSADNIVLMLNMFYEGNDIDQLGFGSYSAIMKKPESPLAIRVLANINDYLEIVFQACGGKIEDEQEDVIAILNNETVSKDCKARYLELVKTNVEHLSKIEDRVLWPTLLQKRTIACSPENILHYFKQKGNTIDEILASFINGSDLKSLDFSGEKTFDNADQQNIFFDAVVVCSDIENRHYETIIGSVALVYLEFNLTEIPSEKVSILIDLELIKMSVGSLLHIRKHYPDLLMIFIHQDFEKYLELISGNPESDETFKVLCSPEFSDEKKIKLLQTTEELVSIQDVKCSGKVFVHILAHNLDEKDIPYLIEHYPKYSPAIQSQISTSLAGHILLLLDQQLSLPLPILDQLTQNDAISAENKVTLFVCSLDKVTDQTVCQTYLRRLGLSEFEKVFNNGRPKIEDAENHHRILNQFKAHGWIKDYSDDPSKPGYLKVSKQKQDCDAPIEPSEESSLNEGKAIL